MAESLGMSRLDVSNLLLAFEDDGSLRDLYILSTTYSDWQAVTAMLRGLYSDAVYKIDDIIQEFPENVEDVFKLRGKSSLLFQFTINNMTVNSHFFSESIIDFDLSPREIKHYSQIDYIIDLMIILSKFTNKKVLLTPEGHIDQPFFTFFPEET